MLPCIVVYLSFNNKIIIITPFYCPPLWSTTITEVHYNRTNRSAGTFRIYFNTFDTGDISLTYPTFYPALFEAMSLRCYIIMVVTLFTGMQNHVADDNYSTVHITNELVTPEQTEGQSWRIYKKISAH